MDATLHDKIDELDLEELGQVAQLALCRIYRKLRNEKDFGYNMQCMIPSIGYDTYNVEIMVVDNDRFCNGVNWSCVWRSI